jgi:hypothetical protein
MRDGLVAVALARLDDRRMIKRIVSSARFASPSHA